MFFDFTQVLFFVLWGLIVLFFILWFFYIYTKRQLVTVLSTTVLMKIFIPLIIMYPFAFSDKNTAATGVFVYNDYLEVINKVFVISLIGVMSFVIGCFFASRVKSDNKFLDFLSSSYGAFLNKKDLTLYVLFLIGIFLLMYKIGFFDSLFGGRTFAMANTSFRPISNFFYSACTVFLMLCLTKYYQEKSKIIGIYILLALTMSLTSGTRGAVLNSIMTFVFMYYNINSKDAKKSNVLKLAFGGALLLITAIYLGDARQQQYNLFIALSHAWDKIFYGNNFSDLRDFAWVTAYWDEQFQYGKTLIAGFLSFIPSSLFPLRAEWGLGIFTVTTIGYDTSIHPGLRPGIFGESYFNFGILGVVFFGFMYGFVTGMINKFVQKTINSGLSKKEVIYKVSLGYMVSYFSFNFMITAGFFVVYVFLIILTIGIVKYLLRNKFNSRFKKKTKKKYRIVW